MICPRCESEHVELMVTSPVGDEWEMYICQQCYYSWRSTEDASVTDPDKYDARFKLSEEQIANMMEIPPIPPLEAE